MEVLTFEFPGGNETVHRAHVGVVGSGDLEVLLDPSDDNLTRVKIRTSVAGFSQTWKAVFERFLSRHPITAKIDINDSGATPGTVALRLSQVLEGSQS